MSNEKIDDFLSWRGRLDDPHGVPGQGLDDHEATWERLLDKIRETPRRRLFFGYRLVAACLLLALIPATWLFQGHRRHIISMRPAVLKRVVSPIPAPPPVAATQAPPVAATHRSRTTAVPRIAATRREKPSKVLPQEQHEQSQLATLPTSPATVTAAFPDTGVAQLTIKPLKTKALRVVNINELSGRNAPEPAVTASDIQRHFEIFLSPSQNRLALPPPPPAADPVLLKVKLSSQN
jgi:hypothetical protein